jgi:hypothetical protein
VRGQNDARRDTNVLVEDVPASSDEWHSKAVACDSVLWAAAAQVRLPYPLKAIVKLTNEYSLLRCRRRRPLAA